MRKSFLPLLLTALLVSCGTQTTPPVTEGPIDPTETPTEQPTFDDDLSVSVNSEYTIDPISLAKTGLEGEVYYVHGVIAQFTYTYGAEKGDPFKQSGFYLVDNTGSMYIFANNIDISNLKIGSTVIIGGEITHFLSKQESGAAAEIGYPGAHQIKATSIDLIDDELRPIPSRSIEYKTINELSNTSFKERDLSGTIFKVKSTLGYYEVSGTDVYYFNDPSMDTSIYTYSSISGAEFDWLKEFVGTTKEWLIGVHSLRSKDELWRCIPIKALGDVEISNEELAGYAMNRTYNQFPDNFSKSTEFELIKEDAQLKDAKISYSVKENEAASLITKDEIPYLTINADKKGIKFDVDIEIKYKDVTLNKTKTIEIVEPIDYGAISVKEAQTAEVGREVTLQGRFVRKAANVQGIYLADDTGIIPVYHDSSFNPDKYLIGEELVFKGTIEKDFEIDGKFEGYNRLKGAKLIAHDSVITPFNEKLIDKETTLKDLYGTFNVDMIGKTYAVPAKVVKKVTPYYTGIELVDTVNAGVTGKLYSANYSQVQWLEEYENIETTFYIFVRDSKNGSSPRIEVLDLVK